MSKDQEHPFGMSPETVISGLAVLAFVEAALLFLVRNNGPLAVIFWAVSSAIDQLLWLPFIALRLRRSIHLKARWALAGAFAAMNVLADCLQGSSVFLLRHVPPLYVTTAWYLIALAALIPLFLLVSLPAGRRYFRSFLWMDILQALFITCTLYVLIFRALPFAPMPDDAAGPIFVVRLLGVTGASIALCLLLHYYAAVDLDERRFYRLFAIILAMTTVAMTINNEITLRHPEQVWTNALLCYPQFLAQVWLLYRLPEEEPEARSARSSSLFADIINIGSPVVSSLVLLSLGLAVQPRQPGLGVIAIIVAFITFTARTVIYLRNFEQAQAALERAQEQLKELSYTDALTCVSNRRAFDRALEQEWQHSSRSGLPLSLILIDVDFFKQLNDIAGHQAGDACLIRIAGALRAALPRSTDVLGRYGGDEFAAILPSTDAAAAQIVAERLCDAVRMLAIAHPATASGHATVSLGIGSCARVAGKHPTSLLAAADSALYKAKAAGRDGWYAQSLNFSAAGLEIQLR
jgi:diguanylate cyclase (GGDEF)-like protein